MEATLGRLRDNSYPRFLGFPSPRPPTWTAPCMTRNPAAERTRREIIRLCGAGLDAPTLRGEALRRLRSVVPVDAAWFASVDPATLLFTDATVDVHSSCHCSMTITAVQMDPGRATRSPSRDAFRRRRADNDVWRAHRHSRDERGAPSLQQTARCRLMRLPRPRVPWSLRPSPGASPVRAAAALRA